MELDLVVLAFLHGVDSDGFTFTLPVVAVLKTVVPLHWPISLCGNFSNDRVFVQLYAVMIFSTLISVFWSDCLL